MCLRILILFWILNTAASAAAFLCRAEPKLACYQNIREKKDEEEIQEK